MCSDFCKLHDCSKVLVSTANQRAQSRKWAIYSGRFQYFSCLYVSTNLLCSFQLLIQHASNWREGIPLCWIFCTGKTLMLHVHRWLCFAFLWRCLTEIRSWEVEYFGFGKDHTSLQQKWSYVFLHSYSLGILSVRYLYKIIKFSSLKMKQIHIWCIYLKFF